MKHGFVTVAAVTPKVKVGDVSANVQEICGQIKECTGEGAKVIVFPALCVTGASCGDLFFQDTLITAAQESLSQIALATRDSDALVFVGLPLRVQGKLYNAAAGVQRGLVRGITVKSFPGKLGGYDESRWFASGLKGTVNIELAGTQVPVGSKLMYSCQEMGDLTVAAVIGDDVRAAIAPDIGAGAHGATLICHLASDEALAGHFTQRRQDLCARTGSVHTGYIYANAGADESTTDQVYAGHNMILENGNVLAASDSFESEITYSEIDVSLLAHEQRMQNMGHCHHHRHAPAEPVRFSLNMEETVLTRQYPHMPFVPEDAAECDQRVQEVLSIQTYGLAKRLKHTGIKKVILGLSGGLDSTLAILVCARTFDLLGLPREQITAVTMPCFGTTGRTYRNACDLAGALGANLMEIPIADAVRQHFSDIGHDEDVHDAAYENSQARERTQILMDLANQIGALHVGTGDLSELALGWATYNGDHMSMYDVNGSVPKTLMRHIVRYIADEAGAVQTESGDPENEPLAEVLNDILDTPISPELLPPSGGEISQSTEDLVGPYELHDFFLYYLFRYGFAPAKIYRIAAETFDGVYAPETILKWLKNFCSRFFSQQFKRSCMSDGPQVGTVDLSPRGSWHMPSDASSSLWLEELKAL